jgi:signal transduction histidine kinase
MGSIDELVRSVATERMARLQEVTSALAESLTPSQVASVVLHQGIAALGARAGSLGLLSRDSAMVDVLAAVGYSEELLDAWRSFPVTTSAPLSDATRAGEVILLETVAARAERYPHLGHPATSDQAWAAVPLVVNGQVIGAMGLGFAAPHAFDADECDFMLALARQCAQALDRARLYDAERHARAEAEAAQSRLAFLAEASTVLASSLDYATTLANLLRLVTPVLADWCVLDVAEPDGALRRVAAAHADPAKRALVEQLIPYSPGRNEHNPVVRALRSRTPVLVLEVTDAVLESVAPDDLSRGIVRALAPTVFLILPLLARDHVLGALSLVVSESGWRYGPADLALAEELARRAAVAIDNARLYSEASSAVRARDELLSIVSHDLQNPLTVIGVQAELLARRIARDEIADTPGLLAGLERINGEAAKMQRLIGDLLDFARIQVGQALKLDLRPVDLAALARQVVAELQQSTNRHQIQLVAADVALTGCWDAARVERMLDNLVSNAIKYSPHGGEIVVELASAEDGGRAWAVVRVRDQGVGIPPVALPHIFDRFYRADNVAGTIAGTGIGLASARRIAEQHGGSIMAESAEGQGSVFTVQLPLG